MNIWRPGRKHRGVLVGSPGGCNGGGRGFPGSGRIILFRLGFFYIAVVGHRRSNHGLPVRDYNFSNKLSLRSLPSSTGKLRFVTACNDKEYGAATQSVDWHDTDTNQHMHTH